MEFGWDPTKNEEVRSKRGFGLGTAARIFLGRVVTWQDIRYDYGEIRMLAVGQYEGQFYTVVYTDRDEIRWVITAWLSNRKERAMVRVTLEELASRPSDVDRAKLDATTEEDIRRHMIEDGYDPDDPDYFKDAVVVRPPHMVRERLGMTQVEFAKAIGAPLATLKNWEQGRTMVPPYVRVLLDIFDREPEAALRAIGLSPSLAT